MNGKNWLYRGVNNFVSVFRKDDSRGNGHFDNVSESSIKRIQALSKDYDTRFKYSDTLLQISIRTDKRSK
jgi:hypothetical protein